LLPCRCGSQDDPLPFTTRAGHRTSDAIARSRQRTAAFRLSALFILLRQGGEPSRIYRLYREEGLTVRKRRARRRAAGTGAPILVEAAANARWSLDFVHDSSSAADGSAS
jgi:putative transposase